VLAYKFQLERRVIFFFIGTFKRSNVQLRFAFLSGVKIKTNIFLIQRKHSINIFSYSIETEDAQTVGSIIKISV